ncbi:hypothetical protein Mapa_006116 [Marchantia paleacea]|nr:hypothetical protein Mapa_006116 [Marchantia paleacea]
MTEAAAEVSNKPVDANQTAVDEKEAQEFLIKTAETKPSDDVPKETVSHSIENGSEHGEQKPDDSVKEKAPTGTSTGVDSGSTDDGKEPSLTTGDVRLEDTSTEETEFLQSLEEPLDTKSATVDTHDSEPDQNEQLQRILGKKNEDDDILAEQLVSAPSGIAEQKEGSFSSPLETDGLVSDELVSASGGAEEEKGSDVVSRNKVPESEADPLPTAGQELTSGEVDSSKVSVIGAEGVGEEIATEVGGGEPIASHPADVAVVQDAGNDVPKTPETTKLDELTLTHESESSGVTAEDTDKDIVPSLDGHEEEHSSSSTDKDVHVSAGSEEEGGKADLFVTKDNDLLESLPEPEDVNVAGTDSQENSDSGGVKEGIVAKVNSSVEGTEPMAANGTDEEVAVSTSEADSDTKQSPGVVESVGDGVIALSSGVLAKAKESAGLEKVNDSNVPVSEVESKQSSEVVEADDTAKEIGVSSGPEEPDTSEAEEKIESASDEPELSAQAEHIGTEERGLFEFEKELAEASIVEKVRDSDNPVSEEEPKQNPGVLESVGDGVISLSGAVVAKAKGLVGLETVSDPEGPLSEGEQKDISGLLEADGNLEGSAKDIGAGEVTPVDVTGAEDKSGRKLDDGEHIKEELTGLQEKSFTDAGDRVPEESVMEKIIDTQNPVSEEDAKQDPGVLESVGDAVLSFSSVVPASEALVGLEKSKDSEGEPRQSSAVTDENEEEVAPKEGPDETPPVNVTDAVCETESKPKEENPLTNVDTVESQERSSFEAGNDLPAESSLEKATASENSVSETEPKQSTGILESVGGGVMSLGSVAFANAKGLVGLGKPSSDSETADEYQKESTQSVDDRDTPQTRPEIIVPDTTTTVNTEKELPSPPLAVKDELEEYMSTSAPNALGAKEEKESGSLGSVQADQSKKPIFVAADKVLPTLYKLPTPPISVNDEPQDYGLTSIPNSSADKDKKEVDGVGTVLSESSPVSSQIGKISNSKSIDEPQTEVADRSKALPSDEQNSSGLQNVTGGTEGLALEKSDMEDGVKERSFNVVVPDRDAVKKPVEETVLSPSTPSTPSTPGGTPLIKRVEQLEKKLAQFEDKQNSPKSQKSSTGPSSPRSSVDRPSRLARHTLEETLSKGSLLDRVAALERKLGHVLSLPGDLHGQDVSAGAAVPPAVKAEAPVATEPGSKIATQEENVKAPLKPLKLEYERNAPRVSNSEVESKAAEDSIEPKGAIMPRAVENLSSANTAEDPNKVKVSEDPTTLNSSQNWKASEGSRSVNFGQYTQPTSTTAEVKTTSEIPVPDKVPEKDPVQLQQQPAVPRKSLSLRSRNLKTEGPVSKLKARFKTCFGKGGKKQTAV